MTRNHLEKKRRERQRVNLYSNLILEKRKKDKEKNSVQNLLAKQNAQARPAPKKPVDEAADKELLVNIFNDLDNDYKKVEETVKKRKVSDIPIKRKKTANQFFPVEESLQENSETLHDSFDVVNDSADLTIDNNVESQPSKTMSVLEPVALKTSAIKISKNAKKANKFLPKFEKEEIEIEEADISKPLTKNNCQDWKDIQKNFESNTSVQETCFEANFMNQDVLTSDGSMNLYWIDAFEKSGRVFLFGKVFIRSY